MKSFLHRVICRVEQPHTPNEGIDAALVSAAFDAPTALEFVQATSAAKRALAERHSELEAFGVEIVRRTPEGPPPLDDYDVVLTYR